MIAIITSCLFPRPVEGKPRSFVSHGDRVSQTLHTIAVLMEKGFEDVVLADNSADADFSAITAAYGNAVRIVYRPMYQFANKGVNEALLLLSLLHDLPADVPLFKISGRYYPDEHFRLDYHSATDFRVRGLDFSAKTGAISTRAYFVRNKACYERFLLGCLDELWTYGTRIVGPGSLWKAIHKTTGRQPSAEFKTSLEFAAARVLKQGIFTYELVEPIGIEGILAGFPDHDLIKE